MDNLTIAVTLSAIIQTYSILLALLGIFYIFVIRSKIKDYEMMEDELEGYMDGLNTYFSEGSFKDLKERDIDWLNREIDEIQSVEIRQRMIFSDEYKIIKDILPKYLALKSYVGNGSLSQFYGLFVFYSLVLLLSLIALVFLNFKNSILFLATYTITKILSIIGVLYLLAWIYRNIFRTTKR